MKFYLKLRFIILIIFTIYSDLVFSADIVLASNNTADLITAIDNANSNAGIDSIDLNGFVFTLTAINVIDTGDNGLPLINR